MATSHLSGMSMNKRTKLRVENIDSDGPPWKMLEGILFVQMRLHAVVEAALAVHQLGLAHHRAMWFIAKRPGITIGELTTILRVSSQALTKTVGQLIERGLVKQTSDAQDRRARHLYLTVEGEPIFLETLRQLSECMEHAGRVCGESAVRDFLAVTDVLTDGYNIA
jgi:DNA-binding MarR family transcriptional regulator